MRSLIISLFISIHLFSYSDDSVQAKLLAKHAGNWETKVEGKVSINGNVVNQLNLSGLKKAKSIFGGKVISSVYTFKGNNFEGGKTDVEGISFLFWDKSKQALRTLDFSSDGMAYTTLFTMLDEKSYKIVSKEDPEVENDSGISFEEEGKKLKSFMHNEHKKYGTVSQMNWQQIKSEDKNFKLELSESEKINEKFIRYKTPAYQWILDGKFLYSEGQNENGKYIAVIGNVAGQTGQKFVIFEDGSLKAYRAKNVHTWDEVKVRDK
ncbi:MAG: hypothetical protein NE327_08630 [Lentisphaeraceae bacterium]|nr:hypothetical protein [Lentisphaeraceae bacterium]